MDTVVGASADTFVGRFGGASVGSPLKGCKQGKSTLVGALLEAFVGTLVGGLVDPLVG